MAQGKCEILAVIRNVWRKASYGNRAGKNTADVRYPDGKVYVCGETSLRSMGCPADAIANARIVDGEKAFTSYVNEVKPQYADGCGVILPPQTRKSGFKHPEKMTW